jgi:hypothetical protein
MRPIWSTSITDARAGAAAQRQATTRQATM